MKKLNKLKEITLTLLIIIFVLIILKMLNLGTCFIMLIKILIPLFIGFIYAWLINPLILKLSKKHKRNVICLIIFFSIIITLFLLLYYLVPIVYKEVNELIDLAPSIIELIKNKISNFIKIENMNSMYNDTIEILPKYVVLTLRNIFKYVGIIGVGLILGLYISLDYPKIVDFIYKKIPKKYNYHFIDLTQKISCEVRKCIYGTFIVASVVFILDTIIFFILGVDASLLLGLMCGLTDLIPYIGPYIGGALAVIVAFTQSIKLGIFTLIGCVIVQIIENCILQPIIMSKSIKISPIYVIISMLLFSKLFGILGMLIATPIVAVLKVLLTYLSDNKNNLI